MRGRRPYPLLIDTHDRTIPQEVARSETLPWYQVRRARTHKVAISLPTTSDVFCLQMEDHYVRIHRPSGSTLELLPLHEAIGRFGGTDGLQVHRSWWVSAKAVTGAERDARNWRLRLTNGLTVPVARNRVTEARTRGWIVEET